MGKYLLCKTLNVLYHISYKYLICLCKMFTLKCENSQKITKMIIFHSTVFLYVCINNNIFRVFFTQKRKRKKRRLYSYVHVFHVVQQYAHHLQHHSRLVRPAGVGPGPSLFSAGCSGFQHSHLYVFFHGASQIVPRSIIGL